MYLFPGWDAFIQWAMDHIRGFRPENILTSSRAESGNGNGNGNGNGAAQRSESCAADFDNAGAEAAACLPMTTSASSQPNLCPPSASTSSGGCSVRQKDSVVSVWTHPPAAEGDGGGQVTITSEV